LPIRASRAAPRSNQRARLVELVERDRIGASRAAIVATPPIVVPRSARVIAPRSAAAAPRAAPPWPALWPRGAAGDDRRVVAEPLGLGRERAELVERARPRVGVDPRPIDAREQLLAGLALRIGT